MDTNTKTERPSAAYRYGQLLGLVALLKHGLVTQQGFIETAEAYSAQHDADIKAEIEELSQ